MEVAQNTEADKKFPDIFKQMHFLQWKYMDFA